MPEPTPRPHARATIAVHGGRPPAADGDPVVTPLTQSVNHRQPVGTGEEAVYTRYHNTPNAGIVHRRLALLEGAEDALVLASGMGATACTMLALLRPGDHLVASAWIYGGTRALFERELPALGVSVTFVDPAETRGWRRAVTPATRVLFLENPVNPTTRVFDLRPLRSLAQESGIALVVDATMASPVNYRALEHGADIVIQSATKYLNGHHDVLAGAVSGPAAVIEEVGRKARVWGQTPDPFGLWLLDRGLKTLDVRVRRQNENALALATWLDAHPAVAHVHYPGLATHPDHELAGTLLDGFGGMLGCELTGGADAATRCLERLALVTHAPSFGGVDTLVSEPRHSSHAAMTPEGRAAIGIPDGFLRVSVGLEAADDLIADFDQALA